MIIPKKINALWSQYIMRLLTLLLCTFSLISCGVDEYTELMSASAMGDNEGLLRIVARGADINERSRQGKTALIMAANAGHADIVKTLLSKGADIDAQDDNGTTALIAAASYGHAEAVKTLVANGADADIRDNNNGTALINSVFFNYHDTVKELLKRKSSFPKEDMEEAFLLASGLGNTIIVQDMLKTGVDVNVKGHNDRTPVMAAIKFEHPDTVQILIKAGANTNIKDANGHTPLSLALDQGNDEIIEILKKKK